MWGIIKTIREKGFGFIASETLNKDIFFNSNELVGVQFNELREGDCVNFEVKIIEKTKSVAISIRRDGKSVQPALQIYASNEPASIELVRTLTKDILRRIRREPILMRQLNPMMFEELVSEIYASEGFMTEIVGSWNQADGGIDIIAVRREVDGYPVKHVIQCKRYSSNRRVSAEPIRSLAGVLDRYRAHVGVVATTSHFTQPAKCEVEAHLWKIDLRDYDNLVASLLKMDILRNDL